MAGFAQGSVELRKKTSGTNASKDHLRIYSKDNNNLFTVDENGVERTINYYDSVGVCDPILSDIIDNGDGTATISAVNVRLYSTNDFTGDLLQYYVEGQTLSFIDGTEQYVVVDYNNGNPIIRVESNKKNINESNVSCLYCCWRQGNEIHSIGSDAKGLGLSNKISYAITDTIPYRKSVDGGLMISELTTPNFRTVYITSAVVYGGVIPNDIFEFNSSIDRLTLAYHDSGNWLYQDDLVYNNTQYDDGTDLQTIGNNKFSVRWFYRSIGDIKQTFYVLGLNYYNSIAEARLENPRNDLPIVLRKHCVLVGRSIIQYNTNSGIMENVQDTTFAISTIQNHNDLDNIQGGVPGEYYHVSASTFSYLSAVSADIQQQLNSKISSAASPSLHNNLLGLQGGSSGNYYHVSASTFSYLSAVSADIQQQLNSKISSAAAPTNHNNLMGLQGGSSGNYYHVSASTFGYLSGVSADIQNQLNNTITKELFSVIQEPTGFSTRTTSVISFNDSTRVFNISAVSGTFDIYYRGNKFTKTSDSITIANTSGLHFIYYTSAGVLTESIGTAWDIPTTIQVVIVYWTGTSSLGLCEERHGTVMDCATHVYLHSTFGTRYANGFNVTYTLNNDSSAFFGLSNGLIEDEDIPITISQGSSGNYFTQQINYPGYFPVFYRSGVDGIGTWRKDIATNLPYKQLTTSNRVSYNELVGGNWTQTEASNNNYVAYFIYATDEMYQPIISVQGQRVDTSLVDAQNNNIPNNLNFLDFPIVEAKLLYRIILQTNNSYTGNTFKVRIVDVTDYRNQLVSTGSVIGGLGTVTYVGLSADPIFQVSGSPIINAGTINLNLVSQTSSTFLASPSATSGIPTFRRITSGDLPTHNQDFSTITNRTKDVTNINTRIDTGWYQNSSPTTATGWPTSGSWWHLMNVTHNNSANYYSLQIAANFYAQDFRIRSTNNNGLQSWSTIYTTTNLPGVLNNYLPLSGGTLTGQLNTLYMSADGGILVRKDSLDVFELYRPSSGVTNTFGINYEANNNFGQKVVYSRILNSIDGSVSGYHTGSLLFKVYKNGIEYLPLQILDNQLKINGSISASEILYSQGVDTNLLNVNQNAYISQTISANTFKKHGGISNQFLKADGSVDSNSYALNSSLGNYLPLSGGTMTGNINFTNTVSGVAAGIYGTVGTNDGWRIVGISNGSDLGSLEISTRDNGNEPIYFRQYIDNFTTPQRTLTLLDSNGNTNIPGGLTAASYSTSGNITFRNTVSAFASIGANSSDILVRNLSADGSVLDYPIVIEKTGLNRIRLGYSGSVRPIEMGGPVTIQNLSANGFVRSNSSGLLTTSPLISSDIPSLNYLPLSGGTLTGQLKGTTVSASSNISAINFVGNLTGYKNVDNGNESTIANGFSGAGSLFINYRGASTTISQYRFCDGRNTSLYSGILASAFIKNGGTSTQFLKADGSVDSNSYALNSSLGNYLPLSGGTLTGQLKGTSISASGILYSQGVDTNLLNVNQNAYISQSISANTFRKHGGTSTQFLKADGSVDSNSYALNSSLGNYLPLSGGTMTGNVLSNSYFQTSNSIPFIFTNVGNGIYNKGVWYHTSAGTIYERALISDSVTASPILFGIGKRGTTNLDFSVIDNYVSANIIKSPLISAITIEIQPADLTTYTGGGILPTKRISQTMGENDYWAIYGEGASNAGSMIIELGDDLNTTDNIKFRFKNSVTSVSPYILNYQTFDISNARQRIYYDNLIDSNSDYSQGGLEIATYTNNGSHSYKPGIGFHSQGQYASLFYLNAQQDWKAKDDSGNIITFYHTGNLPSVIGNYLPLSGGTMTGNINFTNTITGVAKGVYGTVGNNDSWRVVGIGFGDDLGALEIATSDNANEPIYFRQYNGNYSTIARTLTLLDDSGNTSIPGNITTSGSYYVSNYAAGGSPALITNTGNATFYTVGIDFNGLTSERSLRFATHAYFGPSTNSTYFFDSGSTNSVIMKGYANPGYCGIFFYSNGVGIGNKGDNALHLVGSDHINLAAGYIVQETGNSYFGKTSFEDDYTFYNYNTLRQYGLSYFYGEVNFSNNVNFGYPVIFNNTTTMNDIAYFNSNIVQEEGNVYFGLSSAKDAYEVINYNGYTGQGTTQLYGDTFINIAEIGCLEYEVLTTTASYTYDNNSRYTIIYVTSTTASPVITLSDSASVGKTVYIYNRSTGAASIQSSVSNGIEATGSPFQSSVAMDIYGFYKCVKVASGSGNGGWVVRVYSGVFS